MNKNLENAYVGVRANNYTIWDYQVNYFLQLGFNFAFIIENRGLTWEISTLYKSKKYNIRSRV